MITSNIYIDYGLLNGATSTMRDAEHLHEEVAVDIDDTIDEEIASSAKDRIESDSGFSFQ